jgi:Outer membrane receptor proteins, mostly Fe transport
MKQRILLFLMLIGCVSLSAETKTPAYQITGQAVEQNSGKTIPYATVTLQTDSAKLVKKISCDVSGKFSVPVNEKRKYTLILTAMGYAETKVSVEVTDAKTEVGKVSMSEGAMMKTVTIEAQKPLVKVDVDKITYSIEADPDSKTNNGLEMLRKVPLLAVDGDENITLNGQSNYKVLVNGKSSSMMSKNFKDVIKSLPASSIKDIEVITNPSSKYEAEGVGGIINIITVKKTLNGYNGSVSAGFDNRGSMNGSVYLTTKINKFGFSARYYGNGYKQPGSYGFSSSTNYKSDQYYQSLYDYKGKSNGSSNGFSGEASYDIDSLNLISMSFWGHLGGNHSDNTSTASMTNTAGALTRYYENLSNGKSTYGSVSANIDYQKTYKKPDKSLTFSYKIDANPNTSNYTNRIDSCINYTPYSQKSVRDDLGQEHTFQIDYYDPLTKMHQMECGLKAIFRNNSNTSDQYRNDTLRVDQSNDLNYDQYIVGAYAGYVFKLKKFTAKSGLRLERTWNYGTSTSDSIVKFTNKLFNLVPYITLSYQLKPGKTIKLSYTQRLQRPGVWYLNPYVNNTNPLYITYGNPNLVSEISHSFEAGYSMFTSKFSLNTSLNASINNNSIERVSSMDSSGVTTTTFKNIGLAQNYNWNSYLSYRVGSKFNLYSNGTFSYARYEARSGQNLKNEGFGFRGSLGFNVSLWKDASFNGNGGYSSPYIYLQGKSSGYSYTSLGLSQYFLKRKLSLNISVSEPFREKRKYESNSKGDGYTSHSEGYYFTRTARIGISYNFGKMDVSVKKAKRGISNDDVKSGGGSGN